MLGIMATQLAKIEIEKETPHILSTPVKRVAAYLAMEVVRDLRTEIRTAKKKAVVED
jgi:hypothetical protein